MFGLGPKVPSVQVEDLKQALDNKSDISIIDVRTPEEYSKGKIKGSINLPLDTVKDNIESIIPDENKTIYVYCLSGSRSAIAVDLMQKIGYKNVFDVKSGMLAWRAKQYPVEA